MKSTASVGLRREASPIPMHRLLPKTSWKGSLPYSNVLVRQIPRGWASSQVNEGIPQLARFLFLRQAWREVVKDRDVEWIPEQQRQSLRGQAGAAIGPALTRLLKSGAEPQDISTVVRVMQWQLLTRLCYLLSDPGIREPELDDISWCLFLVDEDGQPIDVIGGLHESVLYTDPSGREMGSP